MLREILRVASPDDTAAAYDLICRAERRSPEAVAEALAQPHVGGWLAWYLRRLRKEEPERCLTPVDLGHLAAIAAVAAVRAGLEFEIGVPVRQGTVTLPGLGRAAVGDVGSATVRHRDGLLSVAQVVVGAAGWTPLRRLAATVDGLRLEVALDDLDPFRDCSDSDHAADYQTLGRLDEGDVAVWQDRFEAGWRILVRRHRRYAEAIAAGLTSVVPLRSPSPDRGVNVTAMESFGATLLTLPADGPAFALALLHEFQHGRLGALLDLVDLIDQADGRSDDLYYAPWRADPRPLGALLQGVYAFHGVTDFWRVERQVLDGGPARAAQIEFARWRERVWHALDVLESSGCFTAAGQRFLAGLRSVQARWRDEPVPADALELAREAADDHRIGWQLRNREPADGWVAELAAAWSAGEPRPAGSHPARTTRGDGRKFVRSVRSDLVHLWVSDPDRFAAEYGGRTGEADVAYARGGYDAARSGYLARITAGLADLDAWVGLALSGHRISHDDGACLYRRPELVYAVHRRARASDPLALAGWLDGTGR